MKDNKLNILHLGRKHARKFVLGHYLFLVAHSFPPAMLSENCLPVYFSEQIMSADRYSSIFLSQMEAWFIYYPIFESKCVANDIFPILWNRRKNAIILQKVTFYIEFIAKRIK